MTPMERMVAQVVGLAKLPGRKSGREVAKELRAHLEDLEEEARFQGYDAGAIGRMVAMRFGEPEEIAAAFTSVYWAERQARRMVQSAILVIVSAVVAGVVVGTLQSLAAICSATPITSSARDFPAELFGVSAITAGYCSLYGGERLFPTSLARALLPSLALGLGLAAIVYWRVPQHAVLPVAAYVCAASARLLQHVEVPFVWLAGTAAPLLAAGALFGPLLYGWHFPWLVWVSLSVVCKALQEIVWLFEKTFTESFAKATSLPGLQP